MSKKQGQLQGQGQGQLNLQGQGQGQLNLQGQGQGQGQGQDQHETQTASQALYNTSDNSSDNNNDNGNWNGNGNLNANANFDHNDNDVHNKVDNAVDNHVENTVDSKVNVDVKVGLDLHATGLSSPVIDMHDMSHFSDSLIMPQVVNQTLSGDGNQFNIDQVNNLVNNGHVDNADVSFTGGTGGETSHGDGFSMDGKAFGGDSSADHSHVGDVTGASASGITAHADAALTQSAFTQTITLGANIQFNSLTMQVAGHDLHDSHDMGTH